jgi:hypothetical protein
MSRTELKPEDVGRFAVGLVLFSLLCATLVVTFPGISWVRGIFGSLGFNAGCCGAGVALWCSVRLRERLCYLASFLSIPNAIAWSYFTYHIIYENRA